MTRQSITQRLAIAALTDANAESFAVLVSYGDSGNAILETDRGREHDEFVELAALHLLELEGILDGSPEEILRDVIQTRNEIRNERDADAGGSV